MKLMKGHEVVRGVDSAAAEGGLGGRSTGHENKSAASVLEALLFS